MKSTPSQTPDGRVLTWNPVHQVAVQPKQKKTLAHKRGVGIQEEAQAWPTGGGGALTRPGAPCLDRIFPTALLGPCF